MSSLSNPAGISMLGLWEVPEPGLCSTTAPAGIGMYPIALALGALAGVVAADSSGRGGMGMLSSRAMPLSNRA